MVAVGGLLLTVLLLLMFQHTSADQQAAMKAAGCAGGMFLSVGDCCHVNANHLSTAVGLFGRLSCAAETSGFLWSLNSIFLREPVRASL